MRNIALIGNGYWGKKIFPYLHEFFQVDIVANSKTNLKTIWKNKKIEAVIIATPIDTHYQITKDALNAGKHVFVEKPVAMKTDEAKELRKLAEDKGLKLAVEYTQTFSPGINMIKRLTKNLGHLTYIEMSTKHLGRFMGYNAYWLLASHWLAVVDIFISLRYFNSSRFGNHKSETGSLLLDWFGAKIRIDVSLNYPEKEMQAIFYYENGTLIYDALAKDTIKITSYNRIEKALPDQLIKHEQTYQIDESNNLRFAFKYFSNLLDNKDITNIDRAIEITNILENLEKRC